MRLTGSGLGCVDWPQCNEERFVDVSSPHAAIEQINRLFTGVVAASVIAAMVTTRALRPRNPRTTRLALLMVLGVLAQVVLGGVVVLTGLHPLSNMAHFILSIVLMTWSYWLLISLSSSTPGSAKFHWRELGRLASWSLNRHVRTVTLVRLVVIGTATAIVTGTVVTGSGPHAGDELAPRLSFRLSEVARVHSASVIVTVMLALILGIVLRRDRATMRLARAFELFLFLAVLQGGVGYLQYFTGVPVVLVATHITISVAVWIAALHLSHVVGSPAIHDEQRFIAPQ